MSTFMETCNDTEMNSTFNFSLEEVYSILLEHRRDSRNLDKNTEVISFFFNKLKINKISNIYCMF